MIMEAKSHDLPSTSWRCNAVPDKGLRTKSSESRRSMSQLKQSGRKG